jgi:predicted GNAT family N-acyltransferase
MTTKQGFSVRLTTWQQDAARFSPLRMQVFVNEQKVPREIEIDQLDPDCTHAIAEDASGRVIGTGRLLPVEGKTGRIGRMAVYADWRGRGVGAAILKALMSEAKRRGANEIVLHAQIHAEAFYLQHGFLRQGDVYEEAGIAHITMRRAL